MYLSSHGGKVPIVPQDLRQCRHMLVQIPFVSRLTCPPLCSLLVLFVFYEHAQPTEMRIGSTKKHRACGRTCRGGMVVEHSNALTSQSINVGRKNLGAITSHIGETLQTMNVRLVFITIQERTCQIVGENEEKVRTLGRPVWNTTHAAPTNTNWQILYEKKREVGFSNFERFG